MRVLGVDYGTVRVGVAIGDTENRLARPLLTLDARKGLVTRLADLAREHQTLRLVLGRPMRSRGEPGTLDGRILHFAEALRACGLEVAFWDEAGSSRDAEALLRQIQGSSGSRAPGVGRRKRLEGEVDRTAAALMLQDYLDHGLDPVPDANSPAQA